MLPINIPAISWRRPDCDARVTDIGGKDHPKRPFGRFVFYSALLLTIIALLGGLLFWAATFEIDRVVRGNGVLVSKSSNQHVQTAVSGVILKRLVKPGDRVLQGQALFELDSSEARMRYQQAALKRDHLKIQLQRVCAELTSDKLNFFGFDTHASQDFIQNQIALYHSEQAEFAAKISILKQRILQRSSEIKSIEAKGKALQYILSLQELHLKKVEKLVAKGVRSKVQLLTLLKEHAETLSRAAALPFALEQVRAQRHELQEQEKEMRQAKRISALTEQAKLKASLSETLLLLPILQSSLARHSIYAPVGGVINQINFMSENALVKKGEVVAELIPKAVELMVHAQLDPKDLPNITKGDRVKLRLTTKDSYQFANLDGYVQRISADVIKTSKSDKSFYFTRISIKRNSSGVVQDLPRLRPGMEIEFNILSGKRTVLDYLAQPVARVQKRAFRD